MSIAEKNKVLSANNVIIAENINKVFNAGYEKGKSEGGSGEDLFQYATNGMHLFASATFPDNYELTINMPNVKESMERVARYAKGLRKITLKGNTANNSVSFQYSFQGTADSFLEIVDATEWGDGGLKPSYANNMFSNSKLHTVLGEIDFSECVNVNSAFTDARGLIYIRFKAGTLSKSLSLLNSGLLSDESIQSIIDGLADLTGGTQQRIEFHCTVVAKLTAEQMQTISNKNWSL